MVPLDNYLRDLSESYNFYSFSNTKYIVISKVPFMKLKNDQIYNNRNININKNKNKQFFGDLSFRF